MGMEEAKVIWMDGQMVPWQDARVHVLTHALHYGTAVFEGIRAYKTDQGPAVFRLGEHTDRLFNSARIYRIEIPYEKEELKEAILDTVRENGFDECYIRPLVYRGYGQMGVNPLTCPVRVSIAAFRLGTYLGDGCLEKGIEVMVSSWNRMAPNTFPAIGKASANYMNSALVKMEAVTHGCSEGIALDVFGYVSEGSAENLFIVRKKTLHTPQIGASILPGITRDSVIRIAEEMGYSVEEQFLPREMLYLADEAFLTGAGAEITPIISIDKIPVGDGTRGAVTKQIQEEFFKIARGQDRYGWLTRV
jgi:branched-chain amino acid aminotransferase